MKSKAEVSVSSTQGKLEVLWRHYEELGRVSVDNNFEGDWKEEVVSTLEICSLFTLSCPHTLRNNFHILCPMNMILIPLNSSHGSASKHIQHLLPPYLQIVHAMGILPTTRI